MEESVRVSTHQIFGKRFSEYKHTEIYNGQNINYHDWSMFDYQETKVATFSVYTYEDDPTTAYFSNFLVREDKRCNGYGKFILNNINHFIPNTECGRVYLWVQKSKSNRTLSSDVLIPWYERHGFEQVPDLEEEDCVWMIKQISNIPENQTK